MSFEPRKFLRHILAEAEFHCFGIDYNLVWDAVVKNVPQVARDVRRILGHRPQP